MGGGTGTGGGGGRILMASVPKKSGSELMLHLACGCRQVMNGSFKVGEEVSCESCGQDAEIMAMFDRQVRLKDKIRKWRKRPAKWWEAKQVERQVRSIQRKAMRG